MTTVRAWQDDTLDAVLYRERGNTNAIAEMMALNAPLLKKLTLQAGDLVHLPPADAADAPPTGLRLWD